MELRHVYYFVAVAEELHFGRAADRIGIAQPALSQQIQQLERELGGRLLNRDKRSVSLTEAGALFLREAKSLLAQSDRAKETARRAFAGKVGELKLGFVESAAWDVLPRTISVYRRQYPDVAVTLRQLYTAKQTEALRDGRLDVGIVGLPPADASDLQTYVLRKEPYWAALPPGHRLAARPGLFIGELSAEPFIATARQVGPLYHDAMLKTCLDAGFSPSIVQTVDEMQTMLALVSAGMGIALIHESAKHLRSDIEYRPLRGASLHAYQMAFVWRKGNDSPIVRELLDIVRQLYPGERG